MSPGLIASLDAIDVDIVLAFVMFGVALGMILVKSTHYY